MVKLNIKENYRRLKLIVQIFWWSKNKKIEFTQRQ